MKEITLDGRRMDTRAKTHAYLQKQLDLPDYYGANLDALFDCLTSLSDTSIILDYKQAMTNELGNYGQQLLAVFAQAAAENSGLRFRLGKS